MVREKNEKGIEKVILGLVCLKLVSLFLVWQLLRVDSFSRAIAVCFRDSHPGDLAPWLFWLRSLRLLLHRGLLQPLEIQLLLPPFQCFLCLFRQFCWMRPKAPSSWCSPVSGAVWSCQPVEPTTHITAGCFAFSGLNQGPALCFQPQGAHQAPSYLLYGQFKCDQIFLWPLVFWEQEHSFVRTVDLHYVNSGQYQTTNVIALSGVRKRC